MNDAGDEYTPVYETFMRYDYFSCGKDRYTVIVSDVNHREGIVTLSQLPFSEGNFIEGVITTRATPTRQGCDGAGPDEPIEHMRTTPDHATDCSNQPTIDMPTVGLSGHK